MVEANPTQEPVVTSGVRDAQERSTDQELNGQVRYYKWDEQMTHDAQTIIDNEGNPKLQETNIRRLEIDARKNWDLFYKMNTTNFYKDRHYLAREFQELTQKLDEVKANDNSTENVILLDLGCGVGNAFWPLVSTFGMPPLKI